MEDSKPALDRRDFLKVSGGVGAALALSGWVGADSAEATSTNVADRFIAAQHALLDDPAGKYRPATRWWLAEGLHTDATIMNDMKTLHEIGIGGVEIVCMPEPNLDSNLSDTVFVSNTTGKTPQQIYSWGSDEWKNDTKLIIQQANRYGMSFSMTSGTHWANANLPIENLKFDDDGAGKALGYAIQTTTGGAAFTGTLKRSRMTVAGPVRQDLIAVVAKRRADDNTGSVTSDGSISGTMSYTDESVVLTDKVTLDGVPVTPATMNDPTGKAAYALNWTPPAGAGTWDIYAFWMQATGQSPTPSATTNVTINYIDPAGMHAFIDYYRNHVFNDPELKQAIIDNGRGEIYMDSLEISTSNSNGGEFWGSTLMNEFETRRGYSLEPYLPYVIRLGGRARDTAFPIVGADQVAVKKVRNDFFETITDMYIDNVLKPLRAYLHDEMNMKLRAEITYGVNYEITTPAQGVDYVETESLEFGNQIDGHRTLAGAAHANGIRYSSETGAGSGQNYAWPQDDFMQIMNTQFASGIQHTVFHGYASISGADSHDPSNPWDGTYWPGHEGMYSRHSERWGPRQPESTQYGDYMPMIARTQAVLQQGKAQMDVAVLRTDYAFNNGRPTMDNMRHGKAGYFKDLELQDNGYTYDYFAPEILENKSVKYSKNDGLIPENVGYRALVIYQDSIRLRSAEAIYDLARRGLPVVIVNGLVETLSSTRNYLNAKAAVHTLGNEGSDAELARVMARLVKLPSVEVVDADVPQSATSPDPGDPDYEKTYYYGKTGVYDALRRLGVRPRAEFAEPNQTILTAMRRTKDTVYLWAYNFMDKRGDYTLGWDSIPIDSETVTATISVDAVGRPYSINTWTTETEPLATYQIAGGRTSFDVTLAPGATTVVALDLKKKTAAPVRSTNAAKAIMTADGPAILATKSGRYTSTLANGSKVTTQVFVPAGIDLTKATWNLTLNSWTPGQKKTLTEARDGYTTKEVYYETNKTDINVGTTPLIAWKDMTFTQQDPKSVSGVGTYTTTFTLPGTWDDTNGAYLNIDSTGGALASVWVNGHKITGYDFIAGRIDVSTALKAGSNTVKIEVASSLRNQMLARGYPDLLTTDARAGSVASYGLQGNVSLDTYTVAVLEPRSPHH
ncbi:twin-arginine translocation signal domain-containing protein [Kribbella pittospori]|uniref:Twin-arginine translocation signal domain-containing protein n=1 Tax=Kribbella pittospori TaxID=722689 RepID=A0A4R0JYG9_9ACTN|nr:glycosyl hydrolase [Kribbella pittospori]TCC50406.1 twin-arginine translocation signal domain-containing protein [Kribbella pittospori]